MNVSQAPPPRHGRLDRHDLGTVGRERMSDFLIIIEQHKGSRRIRECLNATRVLNDTRTTVHSLGHSRVLIRWRGYPGKSAREHFDEIVFPHQAKIINALSGKISWLHPGVGGYLVDHYMSQDDSVEWVA